MIAVLTFRRPADLVELLPVLVAQVAESGRAGSVLVVDNDPDAGAATTVGDLALPEVRYVHEPTPGIAAARNRALEESVGHRVLVFIDDDERPHPGWLRALLDCHEREGCAAVSGPVVPHLERLSDPWIIEGGFFVRQRHATGTEQRAASTANLLLDLDQLHRLGDLRFDERFGLSGGSDTLFTLALTRAGGRLVWCDEAVVTDYMRIERVTRRWVLQRHFRSGNSGSRAAITLEPRRGPRTRTRLRMTARGVVRMAGGSARVAAGLLTRSVRQQARGSRTAVRGAGMVYGASGGVYMEYQRARRRLALAGREATDA